MMAALELLYTETTGSYEHAAVIKVSSEIWTFIQKGERHVCVGFNRCKAYGTFWVIQCYHCQKLGMLPQIVQQRISYHFGLSVWVAVRREIVSRSQTFGV